MTLKAETSILPFPGTDRLRYERMSSETQEAFHAFVHYRDMGSERSIDHAYHQHQDACLKQKGGKRATSKWSGWSDKNGWVERARAYDFELDRSKLDAQRSEAAEVGRRQARMAASALEVLAKPALAFAKHLDEHPEEMERLVEVAGPMQAAEYVTTIASAMTALAKMEREATGIEEVHGGGETNSTTTVKVVIEIDDEFRL